MSEDPFDGPEWEQISRHARETLEPMVKDSAIAMSLYSGDVDPKMAIELGYMIMLDKPIIAVVTPGVSMPNKLAGVADAIIELSPEDPSFGERLRATMAQVMADQEAEKVNGGAAAGRGILGEDFLGGVDPVDAVRELRDADPVMPAAIRTESQEAAVQLAQEMADENRVAAPVKFETDDQGLVSLTFGPMTVDSMVSMLTYLGTEEGSQSFMETFAGQLRRVVGQEPERPE